jgi:hypothetical protein
MQRIRKEFTFDKVAYTSSRRVNQPVIEMELRGVDTDKPELSICGELWNATHTDIVMGGQCLDEMKKFKELRFNTLFKKLYKWWKLYHLNDMHAGTVKQEQALDDAKKSGVKIYSYDDSCKYLESIGLLEDDGYKYGSAWLYRQIPDDDYKEILELLEQ